MPHDTFKDPVCGMEVSYETAQARSEYDGRTYYFCSMGCKEDFDREPEKYLIQDQTAHNHF
jgi:YHS domain-containing protein